MKLNIIFSSLEFQEIRKKAEEYFGKELRIIEIKNSIFEQYEIRPLKREFIPKIWQYRIILKDKEYYFGTI
jgi:hypothetical protein